VNADEFWGAILGPADAGAAPLVRTALAMLALTESDLFQRAAQRLERTAATGPLVDPTAFLHPNVWTNYERLKELLLTLHAVRQAMDRMAPEPPKIQITKP
jgi:hypothetical protein